ncbi:NAD-dependent epimerase/dehydratase family protein [Niallia sp.]|uniref:NAD-dependent epimerase/dehydratase family protein n=1 Tax=Niallia sp. TaxID=2837523 RepID=UPI00289DD419|nr:NAD-dependent epimerase/dehydratase family protein [Niallia sp.]
MKLKNKKVLVTGAYGFIGSHLIKQLMKENVSIAVIVREQSSPWRVQEYLPHLKIYEANIQNRTEICRIIHEYQPDYIFHLAAYGTNPNNRSDLLALDTNIVGTMNILFAAKDTNCRKIICLGSSSEYGDKKEKIHEDMLLEPVDIYGSTKAASTIISHQLAQEYKLPIITLRAFNIFGEAEDNHKLFSHIIEKVLREEEVKLTTCDQYRDYTYVGNIIDGLILAATYEGDTNMILNIASGAAHPLRYFVDLIYQHLDTKQFPLYGAIPKRENERNAPIPDITKIQAILGWSPTISVEEGIKRTIAWYKNKYH